MGNDIGSGVSLKSACFDFFLHQPMQLSNRNPYSNGFDDITH